MDFGAVEITLLAAAVLVGATGTWSPCGFSMIETIGPTGHTGGRWITPAACATFLPGAILGGVATFGSLALLGSALPDGWLAYAIAAAVAVMAAAAEARGSRIAPQIRRQLPEHWRRVMPMPVAAALYGVLLGLGFTTFVLTFGVWALAGISLAIGEPMLGVAVGAGFGVGRALPIVTLAPIAGRPAGRSAIALMAERPGLYRGIRLGDAVALAAAAAALTLAAGAEADVTHVNPGADPSVDGSDFVSQRGTDRSGELRRAGRAAVPLPGTDPAIGGRFIAVIDREDVVLLDRGTLLPLSRVAAPGADALAVSGSWLAIRTRTEGRDALEVRPLNLGGAIGEGPVIAVAHAPSQLSRPSIAHNRLAYGVAGVRRSAIRIHDLITFTRRTILSSRKNALWNPALYGKSMVYVRATRRRDELRIRKLESGRDRRLRRTKARMWSTALDSKRAYVTILKGWAPQARIISRAR